MYVAKHFEAFATLVNAYFDKSLPQIHPNLTILWNVCSFIQILSIVLVILAYYASIMLNTLL